MARKNDLKEKILKESIRLFSKNGFEKTTFQKIADRCKISQANCFYYFKNKMELYEACVSYIVSVNETHTLLNAESIKEDGYERLLNYGYGNIDWSLKHPEQYQVILMLYYLASFDPKFKALYTEILKNARFKVLGCLYAGEREGVLSAKEDPEWISEVLHEALAGIVMNAATSNCQNTEEKMKRKWRDLVELYLK